MSFWKQQSFKDLQKDWYERLKEEGFFDAEVIRGEELQLKQSASNICRNKKYLTRIITEEYFSLLSQKIRETEFANQIHELILNWYADGEKIKVICQKLTELGLARDRNSVRFIIRHYEMRWGIRTYSRQELHKQWPRTKSSSSRD